METSKLFNVSEIELVYKTGFKVAERPVITSSKDAFKILRGSWDESKIELVEQFKILLLNRANRVIGLYELSIGGTSATIVDVKLVMVAALKANASGIILAHNHPSGALNPSQEDRKLTERLLEAGKLLDIPVLDHLIVTATGFKSFMDEGLI